MKIKYVYGGIKVTREDGDKHLNESTLLYHIKLAMNKLGFDLIKKRMWKDGHMVDDYQQYLRTRTSKPGTPHIYISNGYWQIYDGGKHLSWCGKVGFQITYNVYNCQPDCEKMVNELMREEITWNVSSRSLNSSR